MSVHPSTRHALAPLFLRLVLGFGFLYHGYAKLFAMGGHENFAGMLSGLGVPAPDLMAWLVGVLEFGGGLALMRRLLLPIVTALLTINMLVAMFTVHSAAQLRTSGFRSGPQFGAGFGEPALSRVF
jgi:putative oxidoreductase